MLSALLVGLVALGPSTATATHDLDDYLPAGAGEVEITAIETAVLGPEHAAEHAVARRAAERPGDPRAAPSSAGAAPAATGPPAAVGAWTQGPFTIPTYAINAALLPTGKVLVWGRPPRPEGGGTPTNVGEAALWSPWLGTGPGAFTNVVPPVIDVDGLGGQPPGPAPFFCSGLSLLPSGEVVVAGGNLVYPETFADDDFTKFGGLRTVFTFDPFSETWVQQPDLAEGRWYPTQLLLPDGRTIVAGGLTHEPPGGLQSDSVEVFSPPPAIGGQGYVEQKPSADRNLNLYPRLFTLGNGDVLLAGPRQAHVATLDTTDFTWNERPTSMSRDRLAGNAVRRPGGPAGSDRVTSLGGYDEPPGTGPFYPATNTAETIDAGQRALTWMPDAPFNVARANSNTVLLPDGGMVAIGGGSGFDEDNGGGFVTYADGSARQVELYDPRSNSWRLGPAQQEDRAYHSTAVLLPDGRVFSAGDDKHPEQPSGENSRTDTAEIYSPPYLFIKGKRPRIQKAPAKTSWKDKFGIKTKSKKVRRAVLVAPGATTHAVDMNQRHVELKVSKRVKGRGINVKAPPSANVAPPGYYMLFVLNGKGEPSVARFIQLGTGKPKKTKLIGRGTKGGKGKAKGGEKGR